jgi:Zn-dependent M16 (insulinase) family peptidase
MKEYKLMMENSFVNNGDSLGIIKGQGYFFSQYQYADYVQGLEFYNNIKKILDEKNYTKFKKEIKIVSNAIFNKDTIKINIS